MRNLQIPSFSLKKINFTDPNAKIYAGFTVSQTICGKIHVVIGPWQRNIRRV